MNAFSSPLPSIIQGGMGVGVSDWRLARAVSLTGQLGVVSGTALGTVLARRLQLGDPGGLIREALEACPLQDCVQEILKRYFNPEVKTPEFGAFDLTEDDAPREYASSPCSAHLFEEADAVRHDRVARRFETQSGARLDYRAAGDDAIDITHTFVPDHLRGKGLAAQLMDATIEYARQERVDLHASCSYASAYLKRKGIL